MTLEERARDIVAVFNPPRWMFWRRRLSVRRVLRDLESALNGDLGSVTKYGIALHSSLTGPARRLEIFRQTRQFARRARK